MSIEIERKFLVKNKDCLKEAVSKTLIKQGYISSNPNSTVRIRIRNNMGFLTIKGIGNTKGTTRFEWEKEIPVKDANELLKLCDLHIIEKYRHIIFHAGHKFEVDEFLGQNKGLILAEIELKAENEKFIKPPWLGKEVTRYTKYYNSMLSKNPFSKWAKH